MTLNEGWFEPVRERLTLRRKQMGLSQRDVAAIAGIDHSAVSILEGGYLKGYRVGRIPSPSMVARWADALRVDTELTLRLHAAEWRQDFVLDLMQHNRF